MVKRVPQYIPRGVRSMTAESDEGMFSVKPTSKVQKKMRQFYTLATSVQTVHHFSSLFESPCREFITFHHFSSFESPVVTFSPLASLNRTGLEGTFQTPFSPLASSEFVNPLWRSKTDGGSYRYGQIGHDNLVPKGHHRKADPDR